MKITRNGEAASRKPSADWFTGTVWQETIMEAPEPARMRAVLVTFEPDARTNWHTHPLGQTLHVVLGRGLVQVWGEAVQEIKSGDTVWIPPGDKHWHGAGPTTRMAHIAIHEALNGSTVEWLERVTDEQYGG